jgi:hypothetical protein
VDTTTPTRSGPRRERSPFALDRDFKAQTAYVVIGVAVWIGLIVTGRLEWAVAWFMATLFMFGIWRIGRTEFK